MNKAMLMLGSVVMLSLAVPTTSFGAPPPAAESKDVKAGKRKFNFEGDTISTDYLKPGTLLIEGVSRGRRSSLIEVRLDFVNELLRSADDI